MKRMSEDVAGFLSPSTVEIIVCVSAFAYLIKKEKKWGKIQRRTDQIGGGQTAEELRWKTDHIAAVIC